MYCKILNVLIISCIMCSLLFLISFSDCGWKTDQNSISSNFKTLHLLPSHISVPVSKTFWSIFIVLWRKLKKKISYQKCKANLLLANYWKNNPFPYHLQYTKDSPISFIFWTWLPDDILCSWNVHYKNPW